MIAGTDYAIETNGLTRRFDDFVAVEGVTVNETSESQFDIDLARKSFVLCTHLALAKSGRSRRGQEAVSAGIVMHALR